MLDQLESAKRVVGAKQVRRAILTGDAVTVFLADDADPALTQPLQKLCEERGVETVCVRTMDKIGKACRISVGAACAAILR